MDVKKIAIGVPTYGTIKTETIHSIFKTIKNLPYEWFLLTQTGNYIQDNRERIVAKAKHLQCTHLLFVDHDMSFESEAVLTLLQREKEIIGVNFNYKKLPLETTMKKEDPDGTKIWKEYPDGVDECVAVGTGLMLIDLSVFDKISHPWFFVDVDTNGNIRYGEDMWFCKKAREAGYKVWVDTTLKIKHLGEYEY